MNPELRDRLLTALERPHRLGIIGGDLEDQLAHCASWSFVLAEHGSELADLRCVDLGTGGGIPGVALSECFPQSMWMLVEIRTSRATEVERSLLQLGSTATVSTEPAQELGRLPEHRERYDLAVARAFGPSSMTAECAAGLLAVGGILVVSEPPEPDDQRWPVAGLAGLGLGEPRMVAQDGHQFAIFEKVAPIGPIFPRRSNKALRRWAS